MANRKDKGVVAPSSRPPAAPVPAPTVPRVRAYKTIPRGNDREPTRDLLLRFGQLVREARIRRGYSQQDFALHAKLHRTHISLIETGTREARLLTICAIATALRVNPGDLMPILFLPEAGSD